MDIEQLELRRKNIFPEDVFFILSEFIPREELLKCVQTLGIVFHGVRPQNIAAKELADALTENFFKNLPAGETVTRLIDNFASHYPCKLPETEEESKLFKKRAKKLTPEESFSWIWHLTGMSSKIAQTCLKQVGAHVDKQMGREEDEAADNMIQDLVLRSKHADALEQELEELKKRGYQQEKRAEDLERTNKELRDKLNKTRETAEQHIQRIKEIEQLSADNTALRQEIARFKETTDNLEHVRQKMSALQTENKILSDKLQSWKFLKRVGVFFDIQNLIITARKEFNRIIDFKVLMNTIAQNGLHAGKRIVTEAYAYLAEDMLQEKTEFKGHLEKVGFQVRSRPIIYRADGSAKGDWDLGMTIEILEHIDRLDIIVLGTGDSDFLDLVDYIKNNKPHISVELACFQSIHSTSDRLIKAVNFVHYISHLNLKPFNDHSQI